MHEHLFLQKYLRLMQSPGVFIRSLFYLFILSSAEKAGGQNYIFAQLTGSPMNTAGWNLQGDARVKNITGTDNSELMVCSAAGRSGAAFYNQPINLSLCQKWIAEFDLRMFDGTGADGLAFCFLDTPPVGFLTGGGLGIPNSAYGLKVCFDTWNNCIPFDPSTVHRDMPKIELRWGKGYDNASDPNNYIVGECLSGPTRYNSDGKLSAIRSADYNHIKITYDSGKIDVYVNDSLFLSGNRKFDFPGYLGFTASTGGYNDNHSIKNAVIYTQMPPSFAGNSHPFCPYDTIRLGGPANPAYIYTWSPSTGLSDINASSPLLHLQNDSAASQLHTYYVHTAYNNNPGCASTDSVVIKVYPNPKINFITPEICLTDAVALFRDSSYTAESTTLPFMYQWNFGDPAAVPANPNYSALQNPSHRYSAASHYTVALKVTNSEGCTDSAFKIFTVNGAVPKADFNVDNPAGLCSNQAVQITNTSSVDFGSIIRVKIFWGDSAAVSYTDSIPSPGKQYAHNYPNPVSANSTGYTIRMISSSGNSCEDVLDQQVTIQPAPHVEFSAVQSVCDYDPAFQVTQATELTGIPGSFMFSGAGISADGLLDPKIAGPGMDNLLYKYTSIPGCMDSAWQPVWIQAHPRVDAGHDSAVVINQPLQLQATSDNQNGDSFLWSPTAGLNDRSISNPVALLPPFADSVRYFVTATDSLGCSGQASVLIKLFKTGPDLFVPNAFTPGKASNNIFKPIPVGISSLQFFRIYNRWGQLVYSTSTLGAGWDGNISGIPQSTGSYVWKVQGTSYTGKMISKQGTMTLIR